VSKRAGFLVLCVLGLVMGLIGYGIYLRQQRQLHSPFGRNGESNVTAATNAGDEIARDIPAGVVNLATQGKNLQPDATASDTGNAAAPGSGEAWMRAGPLVEPRANSSNPPNARYQELSAEEKELIAAYEREQQARMAPTTTKSGASYSPPGSSSATESSPLAALLQAVAAKANLETGASPGTAPAESPSADDQNSQARKEAFLAQARKSVPDDYLKSTRVPPLSKYEIKAGWEIPAVLEQGLNSDLPGELKALVDSNVYDTATGRYVLIPQGARLVGRYNSVIGYGQNGVQVVWNRIIYPDASSIDLSGMVGQDTQGNSGLRHSVDNHYKRLVGFAVLTSLFNAAFELSQSHRGTVLQVPGPGEVAGSAVARDVTQLGAEVARRNLNIQPTIKVPAGYKFNVRVNRDIVFESPYGR
jgi:type IV secretion system protein VirB10